MKTNEISNEVKTSGRTLSFWSKSVESIKYESLKQDLKTDVVIVGGGIAGVSIAYNLVLKGKKVVLVEDGYIGSGETGRTTAHLVTALDDRYYNLERLHGEERAKLAGESHKEAIDFVEKLIKKENIECEFERLDGFLFLHSSDKQESLKKEFDAAIKAGIKVEQLSYVPGIKNENTACLLFSNQAQFHILKYMKGLCEAVIRHSGKIYTETHAKTIDQHGIVTDKGFTVKADHIVVATNTPVNDQLVIHTKQIPYRSYVIGAKIKKGTLIKALWWDTGDHEVNPQIPPYHYVRLQSFDNDYDLLIAGGEDHITGKNDQKKGDGEHRYASLESWTRERFPIEEVMYRWSGQVMEPMDSLAFIGRNPLDKENVYIVTGDSGNGMTYGTIAGILISDLITGVKNKWEKLYDPSRFKFFKSADTHLKEGIGIIEEYLSDYPGNEDVLHLSEIKKTEGRIVQIKGEKYGAYRDEDDHLHIVSAVCTHMQCIVKWNDSERSWDCPCHGSRFTFDGKIMNGPANDNLPYCLPEKTKLVKS